MRLTELADTASTKIVIEREPCVEGTGCTWEVKLQGCILVGQGNSLDSATQAFLHAIRGNEIDINGTLYYVPETIENHFD